MFGCNNMTIAIRYQKSLPQIELSCELAIPNKGITVLFGPSGSGKTTLLNCLSGLEKADTGYFEIEGDVIDDSAKNIWVPVHERRISYVFQDDRLFPHLTVKNNLVYGYTRSISKTNVMKFEDVVDFFGLSKYLHQHPQQLSGGEKQRVALARALLANPRMLLLDEPISALDYATKQALIPYLSQIHAQLTIPVVYVSHDLKEVLQLADFIAVIENGKVVDTGDLATLCRTQPLLTQEQGASFILDGVVSHMDIQHGIATVNCDDNLIQLSGGKLKLNQQVRILVNARNVSLSLTQALDSSILNILPVTIQYVHDAIDGKQLVECLMGASTPILALLSPRSVDKLTLKPGKSVFAQFKATALLR